VHPDIARFRANTIPDHAASGRAAQSGGTGFPVIGPISHPPSAQPGRRLVAKPFTRKGSVQIAEIANGLIDPISGQARRHQHAVARLLGRDRRRAVCRLFET
jgi:hypothetical protein